jgi:hypothetical protein
MTLPKVYIYVAGVLAGGEDFHMVAVAEDGEGLGSHVCSHPSFAPGDLHDRPRRHAAYVDKFGGWGDGQFYDVVMVPRGESPPEPVMQAIRARNALIGEQS